MMEIWIRSIARAGGVEMPASVRVLETGNGGTRPSLRGALSRLLRLTAARLAGLAQRIDRAPDRTATCA